MANLVSRAIRPLLVLMIVLLASVGTRFASGQGTLDQFLSGNPDCAFDTFQGGAGTVGPLRQEFVPSKPTLTAVEACIYPQAFTADPAFDLNIRRGTAQSPGEIVATTSVDTSINDYQWLHAEFDPLAVTPGEKLVLEVSGHFAWELTCSEVNSACDHVDPDLYPPGESQYTGADFLFRTYGSDDPGSPPGQPPLTIQWGNLNCSAVMDAADALIPLAGAAGVDAPALPAGSGCPAMGESVTVFGRQRQWGDVDCLTLGPVTDALAVLTNVAGWYIPYQRAVACPLALQYVNVKT